MKGILLSLALFTSASAFAIGAQVRPANVTGIGGGGGALSFSPSDVVFDTSKFTSINEFVAPVAGVYTISAYATGNTTVAGDFVVIQASLISGPLTLCSVNIVSNSNMAACTGTDMVFLGTGEPVGFYALSSSGDLNDIRFSIAGSGDSLK